MNELYIFQLYNRHAMYLASQVGSEFHPLVSKLSESTMEMFRQFVMKSLPFLSSLKQAFSTPRYLAKLVGICLRCEEDFLVPNDLSFLSSTSPMIIILNKSLVLKVSAKDFEYDGLYVHFFMELPKCKLFWYRQMVKNS